MSKLKEGPISWEEAAALNPEYKEVLDRELFGHELCVDEAGRIRWVENEQSEKELMQFFGATDPNDLFGRCCADKNDPKVRELYKNKGYSLFGFWEMFYWEVNNDRAYAYKGRDVGKYKFVKYAVVVKIENDTDEEEFGENFESWLEHGSDEACNEGGMFHKIVSVEEYE